MTEVEWLESSGPLPLLIHLRLAAADSREKLAVVAPELCKGPTHSMSSRKLRLFVCACCRVAPNFMENKAIRNAIEVHEQFADARVGKRELTEAWHAVRDEVPSMADLWVGNEVSGAWGLVADCCIARRPEQKEKALQAGYLRDIAGNPFRVSAFEPAWRTPNAIALAQTAYDERAFDHLPILADALEDAGCNDRDILDHCRQSGEHCRGCWVVDLVLDKN